MKFTLSWISEHIDFFPEINLDTISNSLTNLGLEVESIEDPAKKLKDFTIAKIIKVSPHPNADKLSICDVELGKEKVSVVCGANNVRENLKVVFAPIGATIPSNGLVLKKKNIRGYIGEGMLCSFEELCLEEKSEGIIELPDEAPIGDIYADWLGLSDPIIEIGLTPNRGDCASVKGIARELSAIGLGKLKDNTITKIRGSFKSPISWNIKLDKDNKNACTYVAGRYFKGLKNVESPSWLKRRLNSIGLKPISALVDLTNFITYDLGRPLHVFDAKKLNGDLCIRMAEEGEELLALDNKNYTLNKSILIIADNSAPVSIAGVMGGEESSCDENTTEMFLESAYFNPKSVATSGRKLNILSDARYRFERGVDPNFVDDGINIMTALVLEICGGEVSEEVIFGEKEIEKRELVYDYSKVKRLGGVDIAKNDQINNLKKLGFEVEDKNNSLKVLVPTWRHDISYEVDIVEEQLRINGYDQLNEIALQNNYSVGKKVLSFEEYRNRLISLTLANRGLYESVTFSFLSKKDFEMYSDNIKPIVLDNPISEDLSFMRPSLLPNLINNFVTNKNKGLKNSSLYEVGAVYLGEDDKDQIFCSAGIRSGQVLVRHWDTKSREFDIYDVKKDAYSALEVLGINLDSLVLNTDAPKWYHPGRSASIKLGKSLLGYFGELHPKYSEIYGMRIMSFEIFHNNIPNIKRNKFDKEYISYSLMPIKRDFAFLTEIDTPSDEIIRSIKKSLASISQVKLLELNLFDLYMENLSSVKHKSLGIEIIIQPLEKTLKDHEILNISTLIIDNVKKETKAVLRD